MGRSLRRYRRRVIACATYPTLTAGLVTLSGCDTAKPRPFMGLERDPVGTSGIIGTTSTTGATPVAPALCPSEHFVDQSFNHIDPPPRVLYSWTVPAHIERLREEEKLLIVAEQAGRGRGFAFQALDTFAEQNADSEYRGSEAALAQTLSQEVFKEIRYAWLNPWATRMGAPGESYGNQLLEIELRDEVWVARLIGDRFDVVDLTGTAVPIEEALADPERIGVIYFVRAGLTGGPSCNSSFEQGDGGYREFIIGNEAMVKRWSTSTQGIRDRLTSDIAALESFLDCIRSDGSLRYNNYEIVCGWYYAAPGYLQALALPNEYYQPTPANIANLIETLTGDLFEPDPLVVEPMGREVQGAGGAGGAPP